MRFQIGEKIYDAGLLDELPLKYILQLEMQTTAFGRPLTINTLTDMTASINSIETDEERADHPDIIWVTAVSIWAARKYAGEAVTFEQAVDFPMSQLKILPDPQDHKPPDPTKARARKGSGPAAAPRKAVGAARRT